MLDWHGQENFQLLSYSSCDSLTLPCISLPLNQMSQEVTKAEANG